MLKMNIILVQLLHFLINDKLLEGDKPIKDFKKIINNILLNIE